MKKIILSLSALILAGSILPGLLTTTFAENNPDRGYIIAPGLELKDCFSSENQITCKIFGENPKNSVLKMKLEYERGGKILNKVTTHFQLLEKGVQPKDGGYTLSINIGDWHNAAVLTFTTEGVSKSSIKFNKNGDILEYKTNIHLKPSKEERIRELQKEIRRLRKNCNRN